MPRLCATRTDHALALLHAAAGHPSAGYQQAGYPQQPYGGQPDAGYPQQPQRRGYGVGALIGAGAAGLVGGALLNEAFSDDEPDVTIVNNYIEEGDDGGFE